MKKVIVISGGTDGLGKELAKALSVDHIVIILSPHKEKLIEVSSSLKCDFAVCDVSDYTSVKHAITEILDTHGHIHTLVNNAGIWIEGELDQNDPLDMKRVLEVNTLGVMYLTKAVLPQMKKQENGRIVNVISQAGLYGKAERSTYTASKWAITGFTKSLQFELARYGITVSGFYPGLMKTKLFEKAGSERDLNHALDLESAVQALRFLIETNDNVMIPELGIKDIDN